MLLNIVINKNVLMLIFYIKNRILSIENIILKNMKDFKNKNFTNDYKIIKICNSLEIANKTILELKKIK